MIEIIIGIFVVLLLIADMVSQNQPKQEEPQEGEWMVLILDDDDFDF